MSYAPDYDAPCPFVPDGATDWETQEIRRRWRNALRALDDAQGRIIDYAERLLRIGAYAGVPVPDSRFEHRMQGGGLTHYGMQAEAEMVALARVLDGAIHRMAMAEVEA